MAAIQERKTSDGKTKYRALIRLKGYPPQSATFDRKTDARNWIVQTEAAIKEGRHFKTIESKKHTLAEMIDRYTEQVLCHKPRNANNHKIHLKWWRAQLGYYLVFDVTPSRIAECRDRLMQETTFKGTPRSPATAARYLATLSHLFNIAIREWEWLDSNPVSRIRKPVEPRGRVRFLDDQEREALLAACKASESPLLYPAVVLAISTGMRYGEIMGLQWKDIDFERQRALLNETKNGERRAAPLVGLTYDLLKDLSKVRRLDNTHVFPGRNPGRPGDVRTAWDNALKKAGLADFRFHDLRHTTASYLAMNGATLAEIAEVLGHKTLQMVKRYAHLSDAHTAGVVERMNAKIFG